jgi:hypothetical protein
MCSSCGRNHGPVSFRPFGRPVEPLVHSPERVEVVRIREVCMLDDAVRVRIRSCPSPRGCRLGCWCRPYYYAYWQKKLPNYETASPGIYNIDKWKYFLKLPGYSLTLTYPILLIYGVFFQTRIYSTQRPGTATFLNK